MSTDTGVVVQRKSMLAAYLLWLFFGLVGAHRLYMGKAHWLTMGVLFIVVGFFLHWAMVAVAVWWLIDGIALVSWVRDNNASYVE
jgi:TM2 domain-containing membrane protein YozV